MALPEHPHRFQGAGRYGDESLTIPFADDGEIPRGFVDIGNFNLDGLTQTRAAGIHHLQAAAIDGTIHRMDKLQAVAVIQDPGQTELR